MTNVQSLRKSRGAFFTPPAISQFLTDWAIRSSTDVVLEPSCGEASFLLPAGARLTGLGGQLELSFGLLHGVEVDADSASTSRQLLADRGYPSKIDVGDFFDVQPTPSFDAVIGNPPYIRYQQFAGEARAKSLRAALKQGVRLTGLASSWAAFVIHAAQFLKPDGRLGLVLPAELLTVNYAAQVRRFLLERFAKVRLVMFEELVFPGVLEEVVLLLAEGQGSAKCFEVYQARDLTHLSKLNSSTPWTWFTPAADDKWTPALLPSAAVEIYRGLTSGLGFTPLLDWGETYLGAVTGNNRFFTLTATQVKELGLARSELLPVSPPGSRHLKGLKFSEAAWKELVETEHRCFLFMPKVSPSAAALRYIESGKALRVHKGYKCENRSPWWKTPVVKVPDLLLTYMDHDRPRLTTNDARVYHLNSLYGVSLRHGRRELGKDLLPLACLNSVSLLGAEMVGRSYGGGLLKLEPKEADRLPVPSLDLIERSADELRSIRPQLTSALRQGELLKAVKLVDRVLLSRHLEVAYADIQALREAREVLFSRRATRGKGMRAEDR